MDDPKIPEIVSAPKKKLTLKERKLVKALAATGSQVQAGLIAYNTTKPDHAGNLARRAMARPHVREALELELEKLCVNPEEAAAHGIARLEMSLKDPDTPLAEVRKNLELLARLRGLNAPTQHESKKLTASVKLPPK